MTHLGTDICVSIGGFIPALRLRWKALYSALPSLCAGASVFTLLSAPAALAQDGPQNKMASKAQITSSIGPLMPAAADSVASKDFKLQLPTGNTTRLLDLNLDFDSLGCLASEQNCLSQDTPVNMGFSKSISKKSKKGLDVELVPSASVNFDDEGRSAAVGAVVRIGDDLRANNVSSNTWYVFAGADAEAMDYDSETSSAIVRGELGFSDRVLIGDAQAGVGYRIGSADVSLGYFRREVTSLDGGLNEDGFSRTEDTAALSFTWRR